MYRWITSTAALVSFLALVSLAAPAEGQAQGAQQNETDLAFIKRMTTTLKNVERQAERLETTIQDISRQASQNEMMGRDQYGRDPRASSQDKQGDYRRAEMQMRSTRKRASKEREELVELQRSGTSISDKERKKIEKTVSNLERKTSNMERDIHQRRL